MSNAPKGFATVTCYLNVEGAREFLHFVERAFGAKITMPPRGDGPVQHAEFSIEGTILEISDARPEWPATRAALHVFVDDPDAAHGRALQAGATSTYAPTDHPYGERSGGVRDRWGNDWFLAKVIDHDKRVP
jgi:uncharacterized glyoxalase superfamily protein PhnB